MAARQHYYLGVKDLAHARGPIESLSFHGVSPEALAEALQSALREPTLWERWRALQPDPDAIDASSGASDPQASVSARQVDLHCDIEVITELPHALLKQRLGLLIGAAWTLRDVKSA